MTDAQARFRQGIRALRAWVTPIDDRVAAEILSPELFGLFKAMRPGERQHSLNVLATIRAQGETDPALWQAALLHDCGKVRFPYWLWERSIVVIVKATAPKSALKWGAGEPDGWRRPFVINLQHPQWGADWVQSAGADPLAVALIRYHQLPVAEAIRLVAVDLPAQDIDRFARLLAVLQVADDLN